MNEGEIIDFLYEKFKYYPPSKFLQVITRVTIKTMFQNESNSGYINYCVANRSSVSNNLQKNGKLVKKLIEKHGYNRKDQITEKDWEPCINKALEIKWNKFSKKRRKKWNSIE